MIPTYPNDADGDALRRVASHGSDMSKPMVVDFFLAVPNETAGREIADCVSTAGYQVSLEQDSDSKEWTCYCTKELVLTYEAVIAAQAELATLSKPLGGYDDGWGTSGNGPDA